MIVIQPQGGPTERFIAVYTQAADGWRVAACDAGSAMDFEEVLIAATRAFEAASDWDVAWHAKVNAGLLPYDEAQADRALGHYRDWFAPNEIIEATIRRFEAAKIGLSGVARYLHCRDEVVAMLDPSDAMSDAMADLEGQAIEAHRRGETIPMGSLGDEPAHPRI